MSQRFPPIGELVPQQAGMCLLERVLAHDADHTRCRAQPAQSALFHDAAGRVPVWVGIEYMAQCAAAHGGLQLRALGAPPQPGLFLGSRRVLLRCDAFEPDRPLEIVARPARRATGLSRRFAFECEVLDPAGGEPLVEGRLNLLMLELPDTSRVRPR